MIANPAEPRLLLVEDDEITRNLYTAILVGAAFHVTAVDTLFALRQQIAQTRFDIILLDLGLPDGNGLELISELRSASASGIIVITSSREATNRLKGLESGADQFLEKPLHPRELIACVRNLLTRLRPSTTNPKNTSVFYFDGWSVDLTLRKATSTNGNYIYLTENEFRILDAMIKNAPKPLHRDRILALLSDDEEITTRAVDKAIYRMRQKLKSIYDAPLPLIEAVHGFGYRLNAKRL